MKRKAIAGILLALILVGVFNAPLMVAEIDVDGVLDDYPVIQTVDGERPLNQAESQASSWNSPESQGFNGDASAGDHSGFFSVGDAWNFSEAMEWSRFANVNDNSVEVVIGVNKAQPRSYDGLLDLICGNRGEIVNTVSIGGETIAVVVNTSVTVAPSFVDRVRATGLSRYIEPNIKFQAQLIPNDPYWSYQWGPAKIEADYAWDTTIGDSSVLVAVIDTGIDYNHPDLAANYVALGYDWVNNDADPIDDCFHGTHCAGIIAATINNNEGIAGLAQVRIMAEKGLNEKGGGWSSDLANAIIHAVDQGADVLSNSWGGYWHSNLIYDAVKYACDAGVLVVASAGNEGGDVRGYPAAYKEVVAVTATDQADSPASFTSFGNWVELAAPGVNIYSTISKTHDSRFSYPYDYCSGTSMAGPHVAGVAALIWSQFPSMRRDQVRIQLQRTADDLGDSGFDIYYGYGRINARKAVEQALPNHDLHVLSWERPPYVEPGSSVIINTTVLNFGASSEAGVTVRLLVNGSVVDSRFISSLASGASVTVSCSWSPTVEGRYDVESYVVPVSGETSVANNVKSAYINVRVGRFIRVPADCSSIQEAVDLASSGETIKVASGTYYEHVTIDRSLNLVGEDRDTTFIDANGTGFGVCVVADRVVVRGFTVQKSGAGLPLAGILLGYVKNCVVTDNTLTNNFEGVNLWGCGGNNSVYGNTVTSSEDAGIGSLDSIEGDTISNNTITGGNFGIIMLAFDISRKHTVSCNKITNSDCGICIVASDDNTVVNNTITLSSESGIELEVCEGNILRYNRVENNHCGIKICALLSKIDHNDLIHNTIQVSIETSAQNSWDDGYPSGGNHWSDYNGIDLYSGPYQNLTGSDGIGDTPYIIGGNIKDRYPLMYPLVTPFYGPTAIFTYSPKIPIINETVTFNASASASGWNGTARVPIANYTWDFGDGNVTTVAEPVICHIYVVEGTYTVNLTVTCQDDPVLIAEGLMSDSERKEIAIEPPVPAYGPTADFDYWPHILYVNETVTFDALTSASGWNGTHDVPVANYTWDFDDGNITTTANPVTEHTYAHNRTYTVNLTVTCQDDPVLIAKGLTSDSTWQNVTIRTESPPLPPFLTTVFEDDFESYDVGTFPHAGGWELWSSGYAYSEVIVDNTPTKALQVSGSYGYPPVAVVAKQINPYAQVIGFEAYVKVNQKLGGSDRVNSRVGFVRKIDTYNAVEWYASVSFSEDAGIYAGGQFLRSYDVGIWYKVDVILYRSTGAFSVWIDEKIRVENFTISGNLYKIQAFALSQSMEDFKTYFDEAKLFEGQEEPQGPSPTAEFDFWAERGWKYILYVNESVAFSSHVKYDPALGWSSTPRHEIVADVSRKYSGNFSGRLYLPEFDGYSWKDFANPVSSGNITVVWWAQNEYTWNRLNRFFEVSDETGGYSVGFRNYGHHYGTSYIAWYCNGTYHNIQTYSPNVWYKFELRIDLDQRKYSIYINDVLKVPQADANGTPLQARYFVLKSDGNGKYTYGWIDNITVTTTPDTIVFTEDFEYEGAPVVSYEWDFGDGSYGEGMIVNHKYATNGTYNVTLTVTNTGGAIYTTWQTLTVRNRVHIKADGSVEPSTTSIQRDGNLYTFTDNIYCEIAVERSNVMIDGDGYTLQGTGAYDSTGLYLYLVSNVTIKNLEIKAFEYGIWLDNSSNNSISGNNITTNNYCGVWLWDSSNHNSICGNNITTNDCEGIWLHNSSNNAISGNNITNNWDGIYLFESSNNSIHGNKISANNYGGIYLDRSSNNNTICGNNITANGNGIYLDRSSNNNSICGNNIESNIDYGIQLIDSSNNTVHRNNFLNNTEQVYSYNSINAWDSGYPSGGNYWSDYNGIDLYSGPYQNLTGSDGIGDTPYIINDYNKDRYPLVPPYGPTAVFMYSPRGPFVNETVTFDASASFPGWNGTVNLPIVSYEWDFGDGSYGEGVTVSHTYTMPGTYNVTLTVTDRRGATDTTRQTVTVRNYPVAFFTYTIDPPFLGYPVTFNATLSTPNGGVIIQYDWDFGDGNTANMTIPTTTHIYATIGTYNVTLTVRDSERLSDTTWQILTVREYPVAVFTYTPQVLVNETVTFNASASLPGWNGTAYVPIVSYEWDFGDGSYGEGTIVNHTYTTIGTYNVTLNVTDIEGLWDIAEAIVEAGIRHDVAVFDVARVLPYGATATYPIYWWVNISVTVRNEGDFSETFNVTVYANTTVIDMETVTSLAPGENTTLTFIWFVPVPPIWVPYPPKYTIWAEAEVVKGETNTDNNVSVDGYVAVKIVGDIDGDGKVDFWDLLDFCKAYGSTPTQGNWNPQADFDCDGDVDFWDLLVFCKNYGISVV